MSITRQRKPRGARRKLGERPAALTHGSWYFTIVGLIGVAIVAVVLYVSYEAPNFEPFASYYYVYADLPTADSIDVHAQVRIGGSLAGQVLAESVHNGEARLELQLYSSFGPLKSDATARVRLRSAVGVRFLQLVPGLRGATVPQNGTISVGRSEVPVDLDQVLGTFDQRTRVRTMQLLTELGGGVAGRGEDINNTIATGTPFFNALGSISRALVAPTGAVSRFITGTQGTFAGVDPARYAAADGFQSETAAMRTFTDQSSAVQSTLGLAPGSLGEISTGLPATNQMLTQLDRFARAAQPLFQAAPVALRATNGLLAATEPVHAAQATLTLAQKAVPPTLTLLQSIPTVSPDLTRALTDLTPLLNVMGPGACNVPLGLEAWADSMKYNAPNGQGNAIHFNLIEDAHHLVANTAATEALLSPYPDTTCVNGVGLGGPPTPTPDEQIQLKHYGPGQTP